MSDDIDIASEREEIARSSRIALCEREASKPIPTSAVCLNCGDKTVLGRRWCNTDCLFDWQKEHKHEK